MELGLVVSWMGFRAIIEILPEVAWLCFAAIRPPASSDDFQALKFDFEGILRCVHLETEGPLLSTVRFASGIGVIHHLLQWHR